MLIDPSFDDRMAELIFQARLWWGMAGVSALLLTGLALTFRHQASAQGSAGVSIRAGLRRLRALHESESAIASMEFLMVFLPFLIIVMTVWQLAFMFNAQIQVGYSAYAAARSASVMIPADLDNEKEWVLKNQKASKAEKWKRIRRAAIPGVLAMSPGSLENAGKVLAAGIAKKAIKNKGKVRLPTETDPAAMSRLTLMTAHYGTDGILSGTRVKRAPAKDWYAQNATEVLINGSDHKQANNFKSVSTIAVTVNYLFWLNVPFVGRMIEASIGGFINPATGRPAFPSPYPTTVLTETIHMKVWSRERAIEPCND